MIELIVEGETHPKTFKLKTDDANAELAVIAEALADMDIAEGDSFRQWFDDADPAEFRDEGVEVPGQFIGEWGDVFETIDEAPGFEALVLTIEQQREDAIEQMGANDA